MKKNLLICAFLSFFICSLGIIGQEKELMRMQAETEEPAYFIFVDDATGDDVDGKGTEKKPYKTIGKALEVAESGDTILVGPGIYSESLSINYFSRITLNGSGSGSTTINGSISAICCDSLTIEGFKITSSEDAGIWCDNVNLSWVVDCVIEAPNGSGLFVRFNSCMWVKDSQILNSDTGVSNHSTSYMQLFRCVVAGNDIGINGRRGALTYLYDSEVRDNAYHGILVQLNSQFQISNSSIFNNMFGIRAQTGSVVDCWCGDGYNEIFNNTYWGIYLETGSQVELRCTKIYDNQRGIFATQASILKLKDDINIHNNDIGVVISEFAHAYLGNTSITGNGLDVHIHTGGQAICDSSKIGTIDSDCPHCQK